MTAATTRPEPPAQGLEFALGEQRYCVGIDAVVEVVSADEMAEPPDALPQVAGLIDRRGEPTTVLDPKRVLDLPATGETDHVVVFDRDERLGWAVDVVHRVADLSDADVDPVTDDRYLSGVVNDDPSVLWVDADRVNGSVPV